MINIKSFLSRYSMALKLFKCLPSKPQCFCRFKILNCQQMFTVLTISECFVLRGWLSITSEEKLLTCTNYVIYALIVFQVYISLLFLVGMPVWMKHTTNDRSEDWLVCHDKRLERTWTVVLLEIKALQYWTYLSLL